MKIRTLIVIAANVVAGLLFILAQPLEAQTDIWLPQFIDGEAGGLRWQTTLVFHNETTTQAQVMLHLYNTDGQPLSGIMMNRFGSGGMQFQFGPNGQFNPNPINMRSMLAYRSSGSGTFRSGLLQIQSQDQIQAHMMLHVYDSDGNLISETGVVPNAPFVAGNFWVNPSGGARFGLALANPSETAPATVTLDFFEEDGTTPVGSVNLDLGPRTQIARFVDEWLQTFAPITIGFVRITATSPICSVVIQFRDLDMTQIPILIEE